MPPTTVTPHTQPSCTRDAAHIDYTAFPHIVDSVFGFADRSALLALRGVSHAFQDKANAHLAEHLVCSWSTVDTVRGRHPALEPSHAGICASPATVPVEPDVAASLPWPTLSPSSRSPSPTPPPCPPTPAQSSRPTRVVDFADMFNPRTLSLLPPRVPTLRVWLSSFMHNPAITLPADTIVILGWPRAPTVGCVYEPWVSLRHTRRVVYHVNTRFRAHSELLAQLRAPSGADSVDELVIIVSPAHSPPRPWECAPLLHFLRCVVAAARRRPHMRMSVVNAGALPPMFPSEGSVVFGDDGVAPYVRAFDEYVRCMLASDTAEVADGKADVMRQWSFLTLDEYRARVGGRQYELEMGKQIV